MNYAHRRGYKYQVERHGAQVAEWLAEAAGRVHDHRRILDCSQPWAPLPCLGGIGETQMDLGLHEELQ